MFVLIGTNGKVGECLPAGTEGEVKCNPPQVKGPYGPQGSALDAFPKEEIAAVQNRVCTKSSVVNRHFSLLYLGRVTNLGRRRECFGKDPKPDEPNSLRLSTPDQQKGFSAECILSKHVRCAKTASGAKVCYVTKKAQLNKLCYTAELGPKSNRFWRGGENCRIMGKYDLAKGSLTDARRSIETVVQGKEFGSWDEIPSHTARIARERRRSYIARRNLACSKKCWSVNDGPGIPELKTTWHRNGRHGKFDRSLTMKPEDWCKDAIALY